MTLQVGPDPAQVRALADEGESVEDIAVMLGVTPEQVGAALAAFPARWRRPEGRRGPSQAAMDAWCEIRRTSAAKAYEAAKRAAQIEAERLRASERLLGFRP